MTWGIQVASLLTSSEMFEVFATLIDGPDDEAQLPGQPEEGELRSWLMTIVRWCFNYDKSNQMGRVRPPRRCRLALLSTACSSQAGGC